MSLKIRLLVFPLFLLAGGVCGGEPPALLLANGYEGDIEVGEYWVSEKLDGVRGRWTGRELITRNGHALTAPAWFTANWPDVALDGELWIGRGQFDLLSGTVRTQKADDAAWRKVRFMVFDLPQSDAPFSGRVQEIARLLQRANIAWLQPVAQFRVADAAELDARLEEIVAAGGEGLMLHHQDALYRAGRSDDLLKYKLHDDAEARVIAHLPGKGKYEGMLGALLVETHEGVRFRVGSGLSDAQRAAPPAIGSWITYRYNGLTSKGLPRFPRFVRLREAFDLPAQ